MSARRAFGAAAAILACAAVLTGCFGAHEEDFFVPSDQKPYKPADWKKVKQHYGAFLNGKPGTEWVIDTVDPEGVFKGKARLKERSGGGAAGRLVGALGGASTAGKITEAFVNERSSHVTVKGIVLIHGRGGAGSLCVSYSGTSIRSDQLVKGTFKVLGGTKKEAKLQGSGTFLSLQPSLIKSYNEPFSLNLAAGFKHASVGPARALSTACRNAGKPFPANPAPKELKASFDGFTLGSASGTVYPDGATVTDNGTCGQDLFAMFSYAGPAGGKASGSTGSDVFDVKMNQGTNDVLLLSSPADGQHSVKGQITAPNSKAVDFLPTITLSRNC